MRSRFRISVSVVCALIWSSGASGQPALLRMNQIQVVGTHNSYHVKPDDGNIEFAKALAPDAESWRYTHAPLDVQLDRGVRSLELDTHARQEEIQVFHIPLLDTQSSCPLFTDCLGLVRSWSDRNPGHIPIFILVQVTVRTAANSEDGAFAAASDQLDAETRTALTQDKLLTPDDVRGEFPSLAEAIRAKGWPTLDSVRGRVVMILHVNGPLMDQYLKDRPSAQGRAMFPRSDEGEACQAILIRDDPNDPSIRRLVQEGFIVRTRADAGLDPDESTKQAALASGAQIVSTDFPPGEVHQTGYFVALPGEAKARGNPVSAPLESQGLSFD